jgi:hypothetical protein
MGTFVVFVGKPEEQRWMILKWIFDNRMGIHYVHDRKQVWALVNMVLNFWFL